jgi:predicted RNase H-like HicB family nuclease
MPKTSRKSSPTSKAPEPPRGFPPALLRRARAIALGYRLIIEPSENGFVGRTVEQPGVLGFGTTPEACAADTVRVQSFEVCILLERGQSPPAFAGVARRNLQLNLRLSTDEKLTMEQAARKHGYRSVSDFVREAALQVAGQTDEAKPSRRPRRRGAA